MCHATKQLPDEYLPLDLSEKMICQGIRTVILQLGFVRFSPELTRFCLQERALHNPSLKSLVIFLVRFGNTFVGGAQWISFAKYVGLQ